MHYQELDQLVQNKSSVLCVGLDPDIMKMPKQFQDLQNPLEAFCKQIIELSSDLAIAYKINIAFFESYGPNGWEQLEAVVKCIPKDCFIIADAKRGDIGNTSDQYATYYFERLNVDSITLSPYMGIDSLKPFFEFKDKLSIVLGLTSNPGSKDFQMLNLNDNLVYEEVLSTFYNSVYRQQIGYVVGATHPTMFSSIRNIVNDAWLLIPGVGAQGGSAEEIMKYAATEQGRILVNVSRGISYPDFTKGNYNEAVRKAVETFHTLLKFEV